MGSSQTDITNESVPRRTRQCGEQPTLGRADAHEGETIRSIVRVVVAAAAALEGSFQGTFELLLSGYDLLYWFGAEQ